MRKRGYGSSPSASKKDMTTSSSTEDKKYRLTQQSFTQALAANRQGAVHTRTPCSFTVSVVRVSTNNNLLMTLIYIIRRYYDYLFIVLAPKTIFPWRF